MYPDMEHKWKITKTWHLAIDSMQDYQSYFKLTKKQKISSYIAWVKNIGIVYNLIKNDIKDPELEKLMRDISMPSTLEVVTNKINAHIHILGLTNLTKDFDSPEVEFAKEFGMKYKK